MPVEAGRRISLGWPEAHGSVAVADRIAKLDALWPLRGERLLDVGCGNGSYTSVMAAGFEQTIGVEIEPERLARFRAFLAEHPALPVEAHEMSAEALDLPDAHVDVVTAIEVVEHIVDPDRAAAEIHRVLRPGGAFLITAPNRWFPVETHSFRVLGRERRSKFVPFVPWIKPLHRRIATARNYRPDDLDQWLVPVGFERVGVDFLMPPCAKHASARYLRPVSKGLERTPARTFGVSVVAAYRKLGT